MSTELFINNKKFDVIQGESLFEYAESFGIHIPTSCTKQGKCKECLVEIIEGGECLSERTKQEEHLNTNSWISGENGEFRLSCQCRIIKDSGTVRCSTMHRGNMRIENKAIRLPVNNHNLEINPAVVREGNKVLLDGKEIDHSDGPIFGIAMDLGTTTVVLRLINLETGEITADSSFENPQRFGGSDVMARIHYDTLHSGKLLQRTLAGYITHAIEEFPVNPKSIYEMVVAGNSTMRDLFFRLNVYSIGQNPYRSITELDMLNGKRKSTSLSNSPKRLQIPINPKGRIYGLPIISGHVGADAAACILAVNLPDEQRNIAIMDIGTNTELILGNRNKILAASCPAGPAFEGGNITYGMPGLTGAIEKFKINCDGSFSIEVIDEKTPEGICGSGLIDILSEMLKHKIINNLGRFIPTDTSIDYDRFIIYSDKNSHIYINENDINNLAQAKGANVAGLHTIFNKYGIKFNDVDVFYLAGGFGNHLNIESSKRIGIIPNIDDSKIIQIGNASIEGASIALLSKTKRDEMEKVVKRITHCRLETDPCFFDYFVEGCQFNPVETFK